MTYQTIAHQIIKESIKSAIFIDEKALPFYSKTTEVPEYEEKLSQELYNNFKNIGISLSIQKFNVGDETNENLKQYLFNSRDLVLLDWKLNGQHGEEFSLKLLSDVVTSEHIHFCVIYTFEEDISNIYTNILTYFSGKSLSEYETIRQRFEAYEDVLKPFFEPFNFFNNKANEKIIKDIQSIGDDFLTNLKSLDKNLCEAFKHLKIAFSNFHKSDISIPLSIGSFENKTVLINNTIITIVNKENTDASSDALNIIGKFSNNIIKSNFSFTKLLGLELKNSLLNTGAYISTDFLNVSKETLAFHRKQIIDEHDSDISFRELLKNVYLEQAKLKLSVSNLKIFENNLFEELKCDVPPSLHELASMNVYYNSLKLSTSSKKLDFGDVFLSDTGEYYICITALCDCERPTKTDFIFYFARGTSISIEKAIKLGDSAFISFISKEKAIVWSNIDKIESTKEEDKKKELEQFRYKPVYIKPQSYLVQNPIITDGKIRLDRIFQNKINNGDLEFINLEYVTTIKPTYAQRISNHAFIHPVRVGVDFVKNID